MDVGMDVSIFYLPHEQLADLLAALQQSGYECVGPQVRDGAIIYDTLNHVDQLPWGIQDKQAPGEYRLEKTDQHQAFAWANGPQAIKPMLFKPQESAWRVERQNGKLQFTPVEVQASSKAIIGVRACDLKAMQIQDKVFIEDKYVDQRYRTRRKSIFTIVVNCTYSSANCFCVSAGGYPKAEELFDLALTELDKGFVVEIGSTDGEKILATLNLSFATEQQITQANDRIDHAAKQQTKTLPAGNTSLLRDLLFQNLEHPRWDDVAERCLSCGNCTSVCPTCFCHSESDQPSFDGNSSTHITEWDSCFTAGHSYMAHEVLRDDTRKRYRQWLTHKLGSWHDQFDTSGCVGCGRCITWCPVGIDITEEANVICGETDA